MAFESISIQSTRNGTGLVIGYREDLAQGDVIVVALTSMTGVSSVKWELIGRPELSVAGGAGPNPWLLATAPSAAFTVDSDSAPVHRDGTYTVQATINPGSPGEVRKTTILRRLSGLTIPAPDGTTLPLGKLGGFESLEDTSVLELRAGWATMLNRWLEYMRGASGGGTGTVTSVNAGAGISITGTATDPIVNNTGVLSVGAGLGISITGTGANPIVNNTGVLSITAGANISLAGTAANPIISAAGGGSGGANATLFRRSNLAGMVAIATTGWLTSDAHVCEVLTVGDYYKFVPGATLTTDGITVLASTDGLGQWQRMGIENQQWLQATCWSVSPATGSDENLGCGTSTAASDAVPLRTLGELNRRLVGWKQANVVAGVGGGFSAMDIHLMDDCVTPSAFAVLSNMENPPNDNYVRFIGGLHAVDGGASNRTITGYTAAVQSTNTERTIVISGLGTVPQYVGKMVQTTDGLKTAFVTSQPSADHLTISQVNSATDFGSTSNSVSDFAVNDHVNFLDATKLGDWPFSASISYPLLAQVRLDCGTGGIYPTGNLGKSNVLVSQCFLGSGAQTGIAEFYLVGGVATQSVFLSCAMFGNHANAFESGGAQWDGVAVFSTQGGPFISDYNLLFGTEVTIIPYNGMFSVGIRAGGTTPCRVAVADGGSIASWRMHAPSIDLVSTHYGISGDFAGSDSNQYPIVVRSVWYGSGNSGYLLQLGQGTRSKFPKSGLFVTTSDPHPINLAGIGTGDAFNGFDWDDIPIMDLNTLSSIGDSNPGTSGGRF